MDDKLAPFDRSVSCVCNMDEYMTVDENGQEEEGRMLFLFRS